MSLTQALHEHKERRKKDPLAVMTMVIKHSKASSLTHQSRLGNDEIVMAIDHETKELLYYEDKADLSRRFITLDKTLVTDNPSLCLHNDKQVMVCSSISNFFFIYNKKNKKPSSVYCCFLINTRGRKIYASWGGCIFFGTT